MDIKSVIQGHGKQVQQVAVEMKVKQSTLSGMIAGNPTVKSLRLIAEKVGCSVAEFFLDELPEDFDLAAWRQKMMPQKASLPSQEDNQLPMEEDEKAQGVFVCPHCGAGVSFNTFMVVRPKEEEKECEEKQ